jgi:hydrogenase nickel incorporation protein HypA/HybF
MHEFSIATSIVESVLEFAAGQQSAEVLSVRLAIGELMQIEAEQLSFCYEAITKGTAIEGSTLEIEKLQASVQCSACSYRGRPKYWDDALCFAVVATLQCPNCGKSVEIFEGQECAIKKVKFIR